MMNDPIIDMMIRIKNGYMTKNESVEVPHSKYRIAVLERLQTAKYIRGFEVEGDVAKKIIVELAYINNEPALTDLKIVSKPGKRTYVAYEDLKSVMSGMGCSFLSTPKGIMTNRDARKNKMGGELLFLIW